MRNLLINCLRFQGEKRNNLDNYSPAELFSLLPDNIQNQVIDYLSEEYCNELIYCWMFWARPKQVYPSGDWATWLILAGRGWGKSRTGAETTKKVIESLGVIRIALVGATAADVRDVMIEGESGLLAIYPEGEKPIYEPSKRRITFYNGTIATIYTGETPDRLRGPQHHFSWCDEIAAWKYPQETWDNLQMGLRLGNNPQAIVTTTPRPIPIIKSLINDSETFITSGSTYENKSNLPKRFFKAIINKYAGTRLGRQELEAQILDDNPDALWNRNLLEDQRLNHKELPNLDDFKRVVVSIDPATTSNKKSDETGITIGGIDKFNRGYLIEDLSCKKSPNGWAKVAVEAYYTYKADLIIAEVNNGGDLVESVIKTVDNKVAYKKVHASRGKFTRAEPISSLYEQGKVYHIGNFAKLEDQLCNWTPGEDSPDRLDSLVWLFTELMLNGGKKVKVKPSGMSTGGSRWR